MASVTLTDGTLVPVHTIFCIGRNFAAHARELGNPVPESPVVFIKPETTIVHDGETVRLPHQSRDVHHEVELVALLGSGGRDIPVEAALGHVLGYGVGIDVTARDIQNEAKKKAHPWTVGKGFDSFAPVSEFVPASEVPDPQALELWLSVNGQERQRGRTAEMLHSVAELVSHLSTIFTLQHGDLIFTGTPAGVARFEDADVLQAGMGPVGGEPLVFLRVDARREPTA